MFNCLEFRLIGPTLLFLFTFYTTSQLHWNWVNPNSNEVETLFKMLFFCKYSLILNLMPATCSKKAGTGATKDWESWGMLKKHLFGTFHMVNRLVGNRSVSWSGIKEASPKGCHSHARMGRGSPLCEQLCEQITQQFKNNRQFKNNYMYLSTLEI